MVTVSRLNDTTFLRAVDQLLVNAIINYYTFLPNETQVHPLKFYEKISASDHDTYPVPSIIAGQSGGNYPCKEE